MWHVACVAGAARCLKNEVDVDVEAAAEAKVASHSTGTCQARRRGDNINEKTLQKCHVPYLNSHKDDNEGVLEPPSHTLSHSPRALQAEKLKAEYRYKRNNLKVCENNP